MSLRSIQNGLFAVVLILPSLAACEGATRKPYGVPASTHPNAKRDTLRVTPTAPADVGDEQKRIRSLVRTALEMPYGTERRNLLLSRACEMGNARGCYFLNGPETEEERQSYLQRACAYGAKSYCSAYLRLASEKDAANRTTPGAKSCEHWVARKTPLAMEEPTTAKLIAHPGAKVTLLDVENDKAFALLTAFATSEEVDSRDPLLPPRDATNRIAEDSVVVSLPISALVDHELPLRVPGIRADARDQHRRVYGTPEAGDRSISLGCGPVEIVANFDGKAQLLRQVRDGVELIGFTRVPLEWNWDSNSCPTRLTRKSSFNQGDVLGTSIDQVTPSPSNMQRALRYVAGGQPLYEVELDDSAGLACSTVTYAPGTLKKVVPISRGAAKKVLSYTAWFGESGSAELLGPAVQEFGENGRELEGIAFGCIGHVQLVNETPDALELLNAQDVVTYHPDDVIRWYKTRKQCERAISERPRRRLSAGRPGLAATKSMHLWKGC